MTPTKTEPVGANFGPEAYADADTALAHFIAATQGIEDLDIQRARYTATRRATVLALQGFGWSIQRIADATGRSKSGIGQVARSAQ